MRNSLGNDWRFKDRYHIGLIGKEIIKESKQAEYRLLPHFVYFLLAKKKKKKEEIYDYNIII